MYSKYIRVPSFGFELTIYLVVLDGTSILRELGERGYIHEGSNFGVSRLRLRVELFVGYYVGEH